jgi:hypothetical protein
MNRKIKTTQQSVDEEYFPFRGRALAAAPPHSFSAILTSSTLTALDSARSPLGAFETVGDYGDHASHCRQTGQREQVLSGLKQGTNQDKNSPVASQPAVRKVVNPCFHRGGRRPPELHSTSR